VVVVVVKLAASKEVVCALLWMGFGPEIRYFWAATPSTSSLFPSFAGDCHADYRQARLLNLSYPIVKGSGFDGFGVVSEHKTLPASVSLCGCGVSGWINHCPQFNSITVVPVIVENTSCCQQRIAEGDHNYNNLSLPHDFLGEKRPYRALLALTLPFVFFIFPQGQPVAILTLWQPCPPQKFTMRLLVSGVVVVVVLVVGGGEVEVEVEVGGVAVEWEE